MKIDFSAILVDADDKPVLDGDEQPSIQTILKRALLADLTPDGRPIPADEKFNRFELYMKLRTADKDTDFSLDEVALLDKAVLVFPTLIAGQLHYLLTKK